MCSIEAYGRFHPTDNVDGSSGGCIPQSDGSKNDALVSLGFIPNCIDIWIQLSENTDAHRDCSRIFLLLLQNLNLTTTRIKQFFTDIVGKWYTNKLNYKTPS